MRIRAKFVELFETPTIESIIERWTRQYQNSDASWKPAMGGSSEDVLKKLSQCKTVSEIDAAIGNKNWTTYMCDGCYTACRKVVFIGSIEPKGYCEICISEASQLLTDAAQPSLTGMPDEDQG